MKVRSLGCWSFSIDITMFKMLCFLSSGSMLNAPFAQHLKKVQCLKLISQLHKNIDRKFYPVAVRT